MVDELSSQRHLRPPPEPAEALLDRPLAAPSRLPRRPGAAARPDAYRGRQRLTETEQVNVPATNTANRPNTSTTPDRALRLDQGLVLALRHVPAPSTKHSAAGASLRANSPATQGGQRSGMMKPRSWPPPPAARVVVEGACHGELWKNSTRTGASVSSGTACHSPVRLRWLPRGSMSATVAAQPVRSSVLP
jgi:hypothetical protein